jgi:hypothetical protein
VLAGAATVTCDEGAMAWPIAYHTIGEYDGSGLCMPPRERWAADLAWCQFSPEEIRNGFAFDVLRPAMPAGEK